MNEHAGKKRTDSNRNQKGTRKPEGAPEAKEPNTNEVSVPAINHVGPTLESDPRYLEAVGSGGLTPEAQIAQQAGTAETPLREIATAEVDPLTGELKRIDEPEHLKTRLPGDTSSDPHTDVGPDSAATVQQRGELEPPPAHRKKHAA